MISQRSHNQLKEDVENRDALSRLARPVSLIAVYFTREAKHLFSAFHFPPRLATSLKDAFPHQNDVRQARKDFHF